MELNAAKLVSLDFLPAGMRALVLQKSPVVLLFFLVIVLAHQLAGLSWTVIDRFFVDHSLKVLTSAPSVSDTQQNKAGEASYMNLGNFHLFGKQDVTRVAEHTPVTAPETNLGLILYGVFSGQDAKQGSAIIGQKAGSQEHYNVGDKVGTGVWLAEVRKDHVLLRRGVSYEVLNFPKPLTTGVNIQNNESPDSSQKLSDNKQAFMENVNIVPVFTGKNKQLKGYRILPKKDRAIYNRLGIRPSDIVTAINGIALNDQREAMKAIAELVNSDTVEVQLDRNGQIENKVLNLK